MEQLVLCLFFGLLGTKSTGSHTRCSEKLPFYLLPHYNTPDLVSENSAWTQNIQNFWKHCCSCCNRRKLMFDIWNPGEKEKHVEQMKHSVFIHVVLSPLARTLNKGQIQSDWGHSLPNFNGWILNVGRTKHTEIKGHKIITAEQLKSR